MLLVPALAVVVLVAIYPLGKTIYQSFTDQEFLALEPAQWVGLQNYQDLLDDTIFRDAVWTTLKFTVITVAFEFALGLAIALVVNSKLQGPRRHARRDARPVGDPDRRRRPDVEVDAPVERRDQRRRHSAGPPGAPSRLDRRPGDGARCRSAPSTSGRRRRSWRCSCSPGSRSSRNDLYEAAEVDGANPLQQFWKITLPLLAPAIFVTLIFRTLDALRVFDVFYVFFGNRLGTQSMAIYAQATIVSDGYVGYGAADQHGDLPRHRPVRRDLPDLPAGGVAMSVATRDDHARVVRPDEQEPGVLAQPDRPPDQEASAFYTLVALIFVYCLFPFFWALRCAFTPESDLFSTPAPVRPGPPDARQLPAGVRSRVLPEGDSSTRRSSPVG